MVHRHLGKALALGVLVLAVTGFLLKHPTWLDSRSGETLCVAIDPLDSTRWLRGTRWGVELSKDNGRSWAEVPMLAAPENVVCITFSPVDPNIVYALGKLELVVSKSGGRIWGPVELPESVNTGSSFAGELSVSKDGVLLLHAENGIWAGDESGNWLQAVVVENGESFHDLVLQLHTGRFAGDFGPLLYDLITVLLIVLTVSGTMLYKRKRKNRGNK